MVLYSFGATANGTSPSAAPTASGSVLYGVTGGGGSGDGVAYTMSIDGSGYQLLHTFTGSTTDGGSPAGGLVLSGSQLFGTSSNGGASNLGAIYSMDTDGSGFSLLHSFAGGPADGSSPFGQLTLSGTALYGVTHAGGVTGSGNSGFGSIYKLNTDGTGFSLLRSFDSGTAFPTGLTVSGSKIYGTTFNQYTLAATVFSMNLDGTGYSTLHTFSNVYGNNLELTPLTLIGTTLYGASQTTGGLGGSVFSLDVGGSNFTTLHSFASSPTEGRTPEGDLVFWKGKLYGVTELVGPDPVSKGTIYSMNLDGSGYAVEHIFSNTPDGAYAMDLTVSADGSSLLGVTDGGGASGNGTVFSAAVPTPEPGTIGLGMVGALLVMTRRRRAEK